MHDSDSVTGDPGNPFDELAKAWDDDPVRLERAAKVASAIKSRTGSGGKWLDYGAGTGALGLSLLGHADEVVLADSSAGMLEASRAKIAASGLAARVRVLKLDLTAEDGPSDAFVGVASLQALHHIDDVGQVIAKLAAMVRPGGWLALSDLDAEDGRFHGGGHGAGHGGAHSGSHHTVPAHHGFSRDQVRVWLEAAGLVDIEFATPAVQHKNGRDYPLFLAVARRPLFDTCPA